VRLSFDLRRRTGHDAWPRKARSTDATKIAKITTHGSHGREDDAWSHEDLRRMEATKDAKSTTRRATEITKSTTGEATKIAERAQSVKPRSGALDA